MHHAAHVLPALDESHRRISGKHKRALRLDRGAGCLRSLVIGAAVLLVLFWIAICAFNIADHGPLTAWLSMLLIPVVIVGVAIVVAVRAGRKARSALAEAFGAFPPVREGAPTRCRVCGAALAWREDDAIVSCAFCQAENLVHPDILATVSWERSTTLADFESRLRDRTSHALKTAARGSAITIGALIVAPVGTLLLVAATMTVVRVAMGYRPTDKTIQYVAVKGSKRWCVAKVLKDQGSTLLVDFGDKPPKAYRKKPKRRVAAKDASAVFRAGALEGKRVRLPDGRVKKVDSTHYQGDIGGNVLMLTALEERQVAGACLEGEPP